MPSLFPTGGPEPVQMRLVYVAGCRHVAVRAVWTHGPEDLAASLAMLQGYPCDGCLAQFTPVVNATAEALEGGTHAAHP